MPSFFLMRRRPPSSTLFPYTTLFRSLRQWRPVGPMERPQGRVPGARECRARLPRSEEHTSELQSPYVISHAVFFFNETATTELYTLSLHDALPISTSMAACRTNGATPRASSWRS